MSLPAFLPNLNAGNPVHRAHPLNLNRVGWWLPAARGHPALGPGVGQRLPDLFGSYHGTLTGGPTWAGQHGRPGGSGGIILAGTDDYVSCAGGGGLDNQATYTLALWFKWTSSSQDLDVFATGNGAISSRQKDGNWSQNVIELNGADPTTAPLRCWPYTQSGTPGTDAITGTTAVGLDRWRHIVLATESGAQTVYLDGVQEATGTITATTTTDTTIALGLGAWYGGGESFAIGVLGEAATWQRRLTAAEVYAVYEDTLRGYPATLNHVSRRSWFVAAQPVPGPQQFWHTAPGRLLKAGARLLAGRRTT